ncbi:hypothetical protein [Streptomyces sp. NPDC056982]|uniref:hypothetical protein n=1 Tax=Streptomyces sp. NPDC056982 TaxID=3345986 RepID=UPI0036438313
MSVYYPPVDQHENVIKAALRVIEGTHYGRADNPHADAEAQYGQEQLALTARALAEAVDKKPADEQPIGWTKDREIEIDAIHRHFGLSYANYLVLPRTLLQSMPDEWQAQFVALLDAMHDAFAHVPQADAYEVTAGTEHIVNEMTADELAQAGIEADWYAGETPPEGLSDQEFAEWRAQHEQDAPMYHRVGDGQELDPHRLVLIPAPDSVPHYNRGRTRIERRSPLPEEPGPRIPDHTVNEEQPA